MEVWIWPILDISDRSYVKRWLGYDEIRTARVRLVWEMYNLTGSMERRLLENRWTAELSKMVESKRREKRMEYAMMGKEVKIGSWGFRSYGI